MNPLLQQAVQLHQQGQLGPAAQIYQRLLQANPNDVDALHMLGVIAFQHHDYNQSVQLIERALMLDPYKAITHHNLGATLRVLGRFDEARRHYSTAISLDPNYAEAYFNLSAITRFQAGDPFIDAVLHLLRQPDLTSMNRCHLHFAAAKFYDDTGAYDLAFSHAVAGNEARGVVFDRAGYQDRVRRIIHAVTPDLLARRAGQGFADPRPVFVVGMPRSGTTLVEQILASHPGIFGAGELPDIPSISKTLVQHDPQRNPYPENLASLPANVFAGFGKSYASRLDSLAPQAARVVDKNPINHQHLGLILLMLPEARIIHCRRDTLDTCLSCYFQNFRSGQEFSYSPTDIACFWDGYRRLMDHWRRLFGERILDVDYETVVGELEPQARRLIAFCQQPWDEACLRFHQSVRPVTTASDIQVRQPIYQRSVQRWRRYEKQIGPLQQALAQYD